MYTSPSEFWLWIEQGTSHISNRCCKFALVEDRSVEFRPGGYQTIRHWHPSRFLRKYTLRGTTKRHPPSRLQALSTFCTYKPWKFRRSGLDGARRSDRHSQRSDARRSKPQLRYPYRGMWENGRFVGHCLAELVGKARHGKPLTRDEWIVMHAGFQDPRSLLQWQRSRREATSHRS